MKIVLSENQYKFIRRYGEIKDGVYDFILSHNITPMDTFDNFLTEMCWDVASDVVRKMNLPPEMDYVTTRNQLIRFIKDNFYTELKEYWDRKTSLRENKNINEYNIQNSFKRRLGEFEESLNSVLSESIPCEYNFFRPYLIDVLDYAIGIVVDNNDLDVEVDEVYKIRDSISTHFEDKIRQHYDSSIEMNCPDMLESINESENLILSPQLRRRLPDIDSEIDNVLMDSDPCMYSRFAQYVRFIINNAVHNVFYDVKLRLEKDEFFTFRESLKTYFHDKIRLYYDEYGKKNCPDDPEIVSESQTELTYKYGLLKELVDIELLRRYNILKELVENGIDALHQQVDVCDYTFNEFLTEICWQVSDKMEFLYMGTEYSKSIAKVHGWVRHTFLNHIEEEFDKLIQLNCVASYDDNED